MPNVCKVSSFKETVHYLEGASLQQVSLEDILCILQRCIKDKVHALKLSSYLHRNGLETLAVLGDNLVSLLVEVGCINDAQLLFTRLHGPDEFSWNSHLIGFLKCISSGNVFAVYQRMQETKAFSLSEHLIVFFLKCCSENGNLEMGYGLHSSAMKLGFLESSFFLGSAIVHMYAKFGLLLDSERVFANLPVHDVVSWTALTAGYVEHGLWEEALNCFERMKHEGIPPNAVTYVCGLKICAGIADMDKGQEFHAEAARLGMLDRYSSISTTLIDMYAKLGMLDAAQEVFDRFHAKDVVFWTVLISGYAEHGFSDLAFQSFEQMKVEGIFPNAVTVVCSLKACHSIEASKKVKQLHAEAERQDFPNKNHLVASTLISTYAKCGSPSRAHQVFDMLLIRDSTSWTSLIFGYAENDHFERVSYLFSQMECEGILPSFTTIVCCLKACQNMGWKGQAEALLAKIEWLGLLEKDTDVGTTLVDMYLKRGSIDIALHVFDKLLVRDIVSWTSLILGLLEHGSNGEAFQFLEQAQQEGILPNVVTLIAGLKGCSISKSMKRGKTFHAKVEIQGLLATHCAVGNILIDMYAKCDSMPLAEQVFDCLPDPDVVSWTSLIAGYVEEGDNEQALLCFEQLQSDGIIPNAMTILCILKACSCIGAKHEAQKIHAEAERRGLVESDEMIGNILVDLYAKFGWLDKSHEILDRLPVRKDVAWNALIAGCAEGQCNDVFKYHSEMELEGVTPNALTFVSLLKACGALGLVKKGEQYLADIERLALLERDLYVGSAVVDMYAKCGFLSRAQQVFNKLPVQDLVSWTTLMAGYVAYGFHDKGLQCFEQMQIEGFLPSVLTLNCALEACGSIGAGKKGREIHAKIIACDALNMYVVDSTLVHMYLDCGYLSMARQVFDTVVVQDILLWEALIASYVKHNGDDDALDCLEKMLNDDASPNMTTLICSLAAFISSGAIEKAQYMYAQIEKQRLLERNPVVGGIVVDLYSRFGLVEEAQLVFDKLSVRDISSWNALLAGYADHGHVEKIIRCFGQMQEENVHPDVTTLMCITKACTDIGDTDTLWEYLAYLDIKELLQNKMLAGNVLVEFFAKCGFLIVAQEIFDMLLYHDSSVWTSLIAGYTEYDYAEEAIDCYDRMQHENLLPNTVTLVCLLKACGSIGAIGKGRQIHCEIEIRGLLDHDFVGNSLISLYVKCGSLVEARQLFEQLAYQDVVSWTILMTGYGNLGKSEDVFHLFDIMLGAGFQPDLVSFLVVLNACSRDGLFARSEMYMEAMSRFYGANPGLKHLACIVDLLSRAGDIDTAVDSMSVVHLSPNLVTLHTVLGACRGGGNVELGRHIFKKAICLENHENGTDVWMSHTPECCVFT